MESIEGRGRVHIGSHREGSLFCDTIEVSLLKLIGKKGGRLLEKQIEHANKASIPERGVDKVVSETFLDVIEG